MNRERKITYTIISNGTEGLLHKDFPDSDYFVVYSLVHLKIRTQLTGKIKKIRERKYLVNDEISEPMNEFLCSNLDTPV